MRRERPSTSGTATVLIAGERFVVCPETPLVFGRTDAGGVVGLDPSDMGISALAGSIESAWGVWWVVNQSTKRPLVLQHRGGHGQLRLCAGQRHALTLEYTEVLVLGAVYTHALNVTLPKGYCAAMQAGGGRMTSGTLTGPTVSLTERERDAVTALSAGYLESFPRRREHPNTYEECAQLLGGGAWTAARVRKAVERVKERFAIRHATYFHGPQANYELVGHLVFTGVLAEADLARLRGRKQH